MIQFSIMDLQDISSITNERFKITKKETKVRDTINDVINSCRLHAEKKRQQIKLVFEDNIPKILKFDPARLQQIINNLMSNAIKFSQEN